MWFVALIATFENRGARNITLSDENPFNPRKFVFLMMVVVVVMMMMIMTTITMIRSQQNVYSLRLYGYLMRIYIIIPS